MGQAEQSVQRVYGLAELKQVKDWERTSSWVQALRQDSAVREPRHSLPWLTSWKSQCRSTNASPSQQQATWHCDLHGRLSHKGLVWLGVHGQSGWQDSTQRQWSPQSHNLQSDHGGRSSHTYNTVTNDIILRLNEPAAKGGVWNGLPQLAHSHAQSLAAKTSVDLPPWAGWSLWEWMDSQTGKHSRYHIWPAAWQSTGAPRLEEISEQGQARASQQWLPEGKEWRKEAADIPPSEVENDLCSTRQTLALFPGQPCEHCWETGAEHVWAFRLPTLLFALYNQ